MSKRTKNRPASYGVTVMDGLADSNQKTIDRVQAGNGFHAAAIVQPAPALKLDLGCGRNPREGFEGVDRTQFDGKVKHVLDLTATPWPWADSSVAEAHSSHFLEHLDGIERVHFVNELYRVLVPGGKVTLVVPHWCSMRAYGDPQHKWPPVSEFWFYYLSAAWRAQNTPHLEKANWEHGFACDFEAVWGYTPHPLLQTRNQEYQQDAFQWKKEACQDIIATLTAKK